MEKGLFSLVYLETEAVVNKNRGNKYHSLSTEIFHSIRNNQILSESMSVEKFICVGAFADLKLNRFLSSVDIKLLEDIAEKYLMLSLSTARVR